MHFWKARSMGANLPSGGKMFPRQGAIAVKALSESTLLQGLKLQVAILPLLWLHANLAKRVRRKMGLVGSKWQAVLAPSVWLMGNCWPQSSTAELYSEKLTSSLQNCNELASTIPMHSTSTFFSIFFHIWDKEKKKLSPAYSAWFLLK